MWSSEQGKSSRNGRVVSSSTSSSRSYSSSSPSSSHSSMVPQSPRGGRSMEELWKDITLTAAGAKGTPLRPPPTALTLNSGVDFHSGSAAAPHANPRSDDNSNRGSYRLPFATPPSFSDAIIGSPSRNALFSFCPKRRAPDGPDDGAGNGRHKRMIKNRQSAARSRARKQAYTNELELEIAFLVDENARLKQQCEELRLTMAAQLHTKNPLQRTLSAPF